MAIRSISLNQRGKISFRGLDVQVKDEIWMWNGAYSVCLNRHCSLICVQPPGRQKVRRNIFNRLSQAVEEMRKEGHKVCNINLY